MISRAVAELLAQPRDVDLELLRGRRRRRLAPQLVDQPIGRDDLVGVQQQDREQRALLHRRRARSERSSLDAPPAGPRSRNSICVKAVERTYHSLPARPRIPSATVGINHAERSLCPRRTAPGWSAPHRGFTVTHHRFTRTAAIAVAIAAFAAPSRSPSGRPSPTPVARRPGAAGPALAGRDRRRGFARDGRAGRPIPRHPRRRRGPRHRQQPGGRSGQARRTARHDRRRVPLGRRRHRRGHAPRAHPARGGWRRDRGCASAAPRGAARNWVVERRGFGG